MISKQLFLVGWHISESFVELHHPNLGVGYRRHFNKLGSFSKINCIIIATMEDEFTNKQSILYYLSLTE